MHRTGLAALAALMSLLVACGGPDAGSAGQGSPAASPTPSPTGGAGPVLVALGDSSASGAGDPTGVGWVGAYASLVGAKTGQPVDVRSHAQSGLTTADLLAQLGTDSGLQADVTAADLVVIGIGGGDLNLGDDAYLSGSCQPRECYEPVLADFARNIEDIAAEIAGLHGDDPVVFRAITPPNPIPGAEDVIPAELLPAVKQTDLLQAQSLRDSTCKATRGHGGECIDVLTAFNGPTGRQNAYSSGLLNHEDCCYPSTKGHQLMANMLLELGIDPVKLN